MKASKPAPKAPATPRDDSGLEWKVPLGVLVAVAVLSATFVGQNAFAGWRLTWQHPESEWSWTYRFHPHLETDADLPSGQKIQGVDNDRSAELVQMMLALGALGLIGWGYSLAQQGRPNAYQRLRDRTLVAIGVGAFTGYFNFGHLHFDNFVHVWDTYHYYMGAKYFPELNYELLYDCAAVADAESGRRDEALKRPMTDLRTNVVVRTQDILEHPERCKDHFSPERWESFKSDINMFRAWVNEGRWKDIHMDHGYNATPVWTLAGMSLANLAPKFEGLLEPTIPGSTDGRGKTFPGYEQAAAAVHRGDYVSLNDFYTGVQRTQPWRLPYRYVGGRHVALLNLLDPIYLLLTLLVIWWAFGPRAFAIAAIVLGANFPNRFTWTGGAFLRHDWLFYLVFAICLLKKDRPFAAGLALAYTTLLRLFPGLAAIGPLLGAIEYFRVHRAWDKQFVRFVAGGAVGTALLVGLSFAFVGGPSTWARFAQNTAKHAATPLTNHMGLRTILSYRPTTIGRVLKDDTLIDAWATWKSTRLESWQSFKPLWVLLFAGAMALVYFALRHSGQDPWLGLALGVGFIPFGVELTNYYYCFLMGLAVAHVKRREVGLFLSALAAATLFVEFHPLPGMSVWLDEQYVTMSVVSVLAVVACWFAFTKWGQEAVADPEPAPEGILPPLHGLAAATSATTSAPVSEAPTGRSKRKKKNR